MTNKIAEHLEQVFARYPDQAAIVAQDGQVVDFRNMRGLIYAFAENLMLAGVKPADYVMVNINNASIVHMLRLALVYLGGRYVIGMSPGRPVKAGVPVRWIVVEGPSNLKREGLIPFNRTWLRAPFNQFTPKDGFRFVTGSSGTTGAPKFMESKGNTIFDRLQATSEDRPESSGPTLVAFGQASGPSFFQPLRANLTGNAYVCPELTAEDTLERMNKLRVTNAVIPSLYLGSLVDAAEITGIKVPSLKTISASGGSISRNYAEKCEELLDCEVYNTYGASETGGIACGRPSLFDEEVGLVGNVTSGRTIKFVDEKGTQNDPATGGEIKVFVEDELRITKFYNTDTTYDAEGFYAPGDVGYMRPDGNLVITGRTKDIINSGGNKIAPNYIESAAMSYPGVVQAVAFPVTNESGSEDAGLALTVGEQFDATAFNAYIEEKMYPRIKVRTRVMEHLPETDTQKVDRKKLRKIFEAANV